MVVPLLQALLQLLIPGPCARHQPPDAALPHHFQQPRAIAMRVLPDADGQVAGEAM